MTNTKSLDLQLSLLCISNNYKFGACGVILGIYHAENHVRSLDSLLQFLHRTLIHHITQEEQLTTNG